MDPFIAECDTGRLNHLKATVKSGAFFKRHRRSEKDFTPQRCLTFLIVLCFLLNRIKCAQMNWMNASHFSLAASWPAGRSARVPLRKGGRN